MIVEEKHFDTLTIFYDGHCPLCAAEMDHLARKDVNNAIELVDIHQEGFAQQYSDIKHIDAMKILHGKYQGKTLLGLEVTH
jgi:predicted DCC family thiol-disulfide oxidoreductase YuxK